MNIFVKSVAAHLQGVAMTGLVLFLAAGTVNYWQAWTYLAVIAAVGVLTSIWFLRTDPEVLRRRLPAAESRRSQKLVVAASFALWGGLLAVSGLDHRFGWSEVPTALCVAGSVLMAVQMGLVALVLTQNSHAKVTVGVDEDQPIVTTGMYAVIRHPMYACTALQTVATPIALGSYWALAVAVPIGAVLVTRILDEEELLCTELPGYADYAQRVRHRLVPGIW